MTNSPNSRRVLPSPMPAGEVYAKSTAGIRQVTQTSAEPPLGSGRGRKAMRRCRAPHADITGSM
jgi:hypothetical protein